MKTRAVDRPVAYWSGELLDQTRLEYEREVKTHGAWRAVALVAVTAIVGVGATFAGPTLVTVAGPAVWTITAAAVGAVFVGLGIFLHARKS
jgi:hypothetical protein